MRTIERKQPISDKARIDAVLGLKRDELSPRVLAYAENLEKQIQDIFSFHNITSIEEFEMVAKQKGTFSPKEIEKLQTLLGLLRDIVAKGEMPATIIRVESRTKDIINPFGEVYKENGAPNKEKLNQFEIDLGEILETCKETYRKKGLHTWVQELPASIADIISGDPKQQKRFEAYLKEGRIPVFMPPKSVQLETMKDMLYIDDENRTRFKHFKPDVIAGGSATEAKDGYVAWDHFKTLMENKDTSLVTGVPDTCYIMWVKPTQIPECTLENLAGQKKYIQDEQARFSREHSVTQALIYGIMPAEYCALQIIYPAIARAQAQKDNVSIQTLKPIGKSTYTRFPGVEEAVGFVACAGLDAGDSQLGLGADSQSEQGVSGVRLPVREVKINS